MLSIDRRRDILRLVEATGSASVTHLSKVLGASISTVRRDLDELAVSGDVVRVRGGAVRGRSDPERVRSERELSLADEKSRIGAAAGRLVAPSSTIFVSGGTTTERLIPHLRGIESLTVVTNAVNIAYLLAELPPAIEVVVLGGYLRHSEHTLLGGMAEQAVSLFHFDQAFYGCYGIDPETGISGASLQESSMDRRVIAVADELVVVADATKFTQRGPVRLATAEQISTLVTEAVAPADALTRLEEQGVTVLRT